MYKCPWCGAESFSFWQKQWLGPARSIECRNCKRRVSVPWIRSLLAVSPIILLGSIGIGYFGTAIDSLLAVFASGVVGAVIGFLVAAPLYHKYVPLVPREP
jgi:DNA-directed RNA polymerase subunit RPC12/RpoP